MTLVKKITEHVQQTPLELVPPSGVTREAAVPEAFYLRS